MPVQPGTSRRRLGFSLRPAKPRHGTSRVYASEAEFEGAWARGPAGGRGASSERREAEGRALGRRASRPPGREVAMAG